MPGFTELTVVRELGQPILLVDADREKIARYGINVADVEAVVQAAVGGQAATQVIQGEKLFDLFVVRMQPQFRSVRRKRSATCWWELRRDSKSLSSNWRTSARAMVYRRFTARTTRATSESSTALRDVTLSALWPTVKRGWVRACPHLAAGVSFRVARQVAAEIGERLALASPILLFPEGTSTDGSGILPFYATLYEPAIQAGAPITAASVRYIPNDGTPERELCWFGNDPFLPHLWKALGAGDFTAEVRFGEPKQYVDRRTAAAETRVEVESLRGAGGISEVYDFAAIPSGHSSSEEVVR